MFWKSKLKYLSEITCNTAPEKAVWPKLFVTHSSAAVPRLLEAVFIEDEKIGVKQAEKVSLAAQTALVSAVFSCILFIATAISSALSTISSLDSVRNTSLTRL